MERVLAVTAGSRGIGAAICRRAAAEKYAVAINYNRSGDAAEALVAEIASSGGRAVAVRADVGIEEEVSAFFAEVDRTLGPVTHLVNNAGGGKLITGPDGCPIERITFEMYRRMFDLNVGSALICSREAIRRMRKQPREAGCAIVNVSSDRGRSGGFPNGVLYGAAKGAIDNFTVGLARELASSGIRVNAVRPATIASDAHKSSPPEAMEKMRSSIPMGRMGTPDEVADCVAFLLSQRAGFVTGALLDITGGR